MVEENIQVHWSSSVEALAEEFFARREREKWCSPFQKKLVLVDDTASAKWLTRFFLQRKNPPRRVFANFSFIPVAQFINDWLFGSTNRKASAHPYSKEVLEWRIFFILEEAIAKPHLARDLEELVKYTQGDEILARNLSSRLARLYDEYVTSRYEMLEDWALNKVDGGWQGALYRRLVEENPNTYSRLYRETLDGKNGESAQNSSLERFKHIDIFDVSALAYPWLKFFELMARRGTKIDFWSFNPSLDTPWFSREYSFDGDDKLIYKMAKGCAPTLEAQYDLCSGNIDEIAASGASEEKKLRANDIEFHIACSSARELDAIRNGVIDFLAKNKDATPKDILILFAGWEKYSPLIKSAFDNLEEGIAFRYQVDQDAPNASPIQDAFSNLVQLSDSRFEASAILSFADVQAVRRKFDIENEHVKIFRELVKEANIHWGFDDMGVADAIGAKDEDSLSHLPYTWQRGLDRLLLGELCGETDGELIEAGGLGRILPTPYIENEKARAAAILAKLVDALKDANDTLCPNMRHTIEKWKEILLRLLDTFFLAKSQEEENEISAIRKAIAETADNISMALEFSNREESEKISAAVFSCALLEKIKSSPSKKSEALNAIRLAPLKAASAYDARFVWIAGLDSDSFPRDTPRPSFDLIGSNPLKFDFSLADKDSNTLLRAILCAKEKLVLSYVGKDASGEALTTSMLVDNILEWIGEDKIKTYNHPLSSSDTQYFIESSPLPPNYSKDDFAACKTYKESLEKNSSASAIAEEKNLCAFENTGPLDLNNILEFLSSPSNYVCKRRLGVFLEDLKWSAINDSEAIEAKLPYKDKILIEKGLSNLATNPEALVETGRASSVKDADDIRAVSANSKNAKNIEKFSFPIELEENEKITLDAREIFKNDLESKPCKISIDSPSPIDSDRHVEVTGHINLFEISGHAFCVDYSRLSLNDSTKNGEEYRKDVAKSIARHIAGHAAGLKFFSILIYGANAKAEVIYPIEKSAAQDKWNNTILKILLSPLPGDIPNLYIDVSQDALEPEIFAGIRECVQIKELPPPRAKKK